MWEILCTWDGGRQSFPRLQRPLSSFDGSHVAHTVKSRNTHIHINICVWHLICLWAWINYVAFHKAGCCLFSHPADNRYHSFLLATRSMQYFLISSNSGGKYLALQLLTAAKCSPASRKLFWCWAGSAQSSVSHTYTLHGLKRKVDFWSLFMRAISPAATWNKAIKKTKLTWRMIDALNDYWYDTIWEIAARKLFRKGQAPYKNTW